jgi:hypothetical protein
MAINIDRSFLDQVDLVSLIEQKTSTRFGKPAGNREKRTVKGPCPFCQAGTDRFAVFINETPQRYYCGIHGHGCGAHGDAIDFLRQYEHLSFKDAVTSLNGVVDVAIQRIENMQERQESTTWQSDRWQKRVIELCKDAEARLWSEEGQAVLDYLWTRGLTDETIKGAHLGAALHKGTMALVIPWYSSKQGCYWRVTFRNVSEHPTWRYDNYAGSSVSEGLYGVDSLAFNRPAVFLVEGELDALSIVQSARDLVSVIATGTITGSHSLDWVMELAALPHVFVAFDAEEKAEKSASYWLDALSNATRWKTPIGKDANEMLIRGLNIRLWVEAALSTLSVFEQVQKKRLEWGRHLLHNDRGLLIYCSKCDREATWWGTGATPFCKDHWQPQWFHACALLSKEVS